MQNASFSSNLIDYEAFLLGFMKIKKVTNALWKVFVIVSYHNQGLVRLPTVAVNNHAQQVVISVVKTMIWLIKNEQVWILHKSPDQKYHSLFTT